LRTPIAELRSLAELSLKWPEARSPEADGEVLAVALQMEGIVTRLLALLRSERGQLNVVTENVELAPMVEKLVRQRQDSAARQSLDVTFDIPKGSPIQTDPVLLRSILANLLDNAIEYTPAGGKICLEGGVNGKTFQVRLSNSVEHLSREDVSRFFDRFWRKDAARSSAEHSGLGLPLARAFARALGGDLVATLDEQSRLTLTLTGPLKT
jgi:signal transduction histidine kinase